MWSSWNQIGSLSHDDKDQAQIQHDDTRHVKSIAAHNFAMLRQSLEGCGEVKNGRRLTTVSKAGRVDLAKAQKMLSAVERSRLQVFRPKKFTNASADDLQGTFALPR